MNILLEDFEYFPLQETSAKFGSPQYAALYSAASGADPQPFKKGDKCEWRILATHGEKIILNITSLDIPPSANCQLDYLEVGVRCEGVKGPLYSVILYGLITKAMLNVTITI